MPQDKLRSYLKAIKQIAKYYSIPSSDLEFLSSAMLTDNPKILFVGSPESGKTTLVNIIARLFKDAKLGMIIAHPRKTVEQTLIRIKIEELLTNNKFEIELMDFVNAEIKFINEINRLNPEVWDALLSILEEGILELYGKIYKTNEDYICFADMNPYRGDIDLALKSRFDYSLYFKTILYNPNETTRIAKLVLTKKRLTEYIKPEISFSDLVELRKQVRNVEIPDDIIILTQLVILGLFGCKQVDKNFVENPILKCSECPFSNGYCRYVKHTSGFRTIRSTLNLIRARAYIRQREPSPEDVIFALNYTLPHRIELFDKYKSMYYNLQKFVSDYLFVVRSKLDINIEFVKAIITQNIEKILEIRSKETNIGIEILADRIVNIDAIKNSIEGLIKKLSDPSLFNVKDYERLMIEKNHAEKIAKSYMQGTIDKASKVLEESLYQIPVGNLDKHIKVLESLGLDNKTITTIRSVIGYVYEPKDKKFRILRGTNTITIIAHKSIIDKLRAGS